jgi:hypothetical protein
MLTGDELRLIELGTDGPFDTRIRTTGVSSRPVGPGTTLTLVPQRLLGQERVDVHLAVAGHPPLAVLGMFRKAGELLRDLADPAGGR